MTNFVMRLRNRSIDRYTTNSEWETVKSTFLHNLNVSIQAIQAGNPLRAPFVRQVAKNGDVERVFLGFAFCYAKDKKTKHPHAFPNRFLEKNAFLPADAELAAVLAELVQDEAAMADLLEDLKSAWEAKVANGVRGREKASANVAHFASTAVFEGGYAVAAE